MKKICVLPDSVISKIAAGEVIERPASVLKELLENSLDAGAATINIDFTQAGKSCLRVNDDGSGIAPSELELALKRHSTNKILDFDDLEKLNTFGFRGEALYSISAVSKLTLKSSLKNSSSGAEIYAEGGKIIKNIPSIPVGGTTIEVKDLFFNTPARKKFLKSDSTEKNRILKVIEESALVNTHCAFGVRSGGKEIYSLPAQNKDIKTNLYNRIKSIFTGDIAARLKYVSEKFIDARAFIGTVNRFSTAKNMQFFFVNKRPVTSLILRQALYRALSNYTDKNARIVSFMYFNLNPDTFDVNIHPQKKEVRFKDEGLIFSIVSKMVARAFSQISTSAPAKEQAVYYVQDKERSLAQDFKPENIKENDVKIPVPSVENFEMSDSKDLKKIVQSEIVSKNGQGAETPPAEQKQISAYAEKSRMFKPFYRFLGQASQSYLLFETENGILVIDQHAAQERVLFEKYLGEFDSSKPQVQKFMVPVNVEMTASQIENIMSAHEWLRNAGFEIDRFGPKTVLINAAPQIFGFGDDNIKNFILSLVDTDLNPQSENETVKRSKIARLACKNSVKAHKTLSREEAVNLLKNLHKCRHCNICPHGRPVSFTISKFEIAKKFQRTKIL